MFVRLRGNREEIANSMWSWIKLLSSAYHRQQTSDVNPSDLHLSLSNALQLNASFLLQWLSIYMAAYKQEHVQHIYTCACVCGVSPINTYHVHSHIRNIIFFWRQIRIYHMISIIYVLQESSLAASSGCLYPHFTAAACILLLYLSHIT